MMIPIPPEDIREVPTSVLAYVGDAVYELYVRMHIVARFGGQSGVLHKKAVHYVSAPAQAQAIRVLHDDLSEEEQIAIYERLDEQCRKYLGKSCEDLLKDAEKEMMDYFYDD